MSKNRPSQDLQKTILQRLKPVQICDLCGTVETVVIPGSIMSPVPGRDEASGKPVDEPSDKSNATTGEKMQIPRH